MWEQVKVAPNFRRYVNGRCQVKMTPGRRERHSADKQTVPGKGGTRSGGIAGRVGGKVSG